MIYIVQVMCWRFVICRPAQVARCDAAEDLYAAAAVQVPGRRRAWESTGQMRNRSRAELVEF